MTFLTKTAVAFLLSTVAIYSASASDDGLVTFEVYAEQQVANNEAVARLSKTVNAKTTKALASQITPVINQALEIAKTYPTVKASTSYQNSYPQYDKNGKITGFVSSSSIELVSQNTDDLAELIAKLQEQLVLDDLSFYVSDDVKERIENELMQKATQKFRQKAQNLTNAWQANSYKLINAQMNTSNHFAEPLMMASYMKAQDASVSVPTFNAGDSTISYTIHGTIKLEP